MPKRSSRVTVPYDSWTEEVPTKSAGSATRRCSRACRSVWPRCCNNSGSSRCLRPSGRRYFFRQNELPCSASAWPLPAGPRATLGLSQPRSAGQPGCRTEPFAWFAAISSPTCRASIRSTTIASTTTGGATASAAASPGAGPGGGEGLLEVPFWAWRSGAGRRGRLLASGDASQIRLRVGNEEWPSIPLTAQQPSRPGRNWSSAVSRCAVGP